MIGKVLRCIGAATLVIIIVLCLSVSVPHLLGYTQYVVVSGSMEPAIPVGSLVFSKPTEPAELVQGEVIVFYTERHTKTPVTHRVVENRFADREIITKGDANDDNDPSPVSYDDVIGKVEHHIPRLGYLTAPLGTGPGKAAALAVIIAGYLLAMYGGNIRIKKDPKGPDEDIELE